MKFIIRKIKVFITFTQNLSVIFFRTHSTLIRLIGIIGGSSIVMFSFRVVSKIIFIYINRGELIESIILDQIQRTNFHPIDSELAQVIFEMCTKLDGVGFTPDWKIHINAEVFTELELRSGVKEILLNNHLNFGLSPADMANDARMDEHVDAILDLFKRKMETRPNFDRFFENQEETRKYYQANFYKFEQTRPLGYAGCILFLRHWYVYVGVGLATMATVYVAYKVGAPIANDTAATIINSYFPPNPFK